MIDTDLTAGAVPALAGQAAPGQDHNLEKRGIVTMNDSTAVSVAARSEALSPNQSVLDRISAMIGAVVTELDEKKAAVELACEARKEAEAAEKAARDDYAVALNSATTTGGVPAPMLKEFGHVKPRGAGTGRPRGRRAGTGRGASHKSRAEVAGTGNPSVHTEHYATGADD